jgi:hypothetical protein
MTQTEEGPSPRDFSRANRRGAGVCGRPAAFTRATSYDAQMMPRDKSDIQKGHNHVYRTEHDNHLANSLAAARPMPLAAPVMTATRPACMTG